MVKKENVMQVENIKNMWIECKKRIEQYWNVHKKRKASLTSVKWIKKKEDFFFGWQTCVFLFFLFFG